MPQSGYTGISYPFRVTPQGGVATSTTSSTDPRHIVESIQQILNTNFLERPMESKIYSSIDSLLFEPNDVALQQILKAQIVKDLTRLDKRISVKQQDITFSVDTSEGIEYLYATIHFNIIKYNTYYTAKVKVGEVNG